MPDERRRGGFSGGVFVSGAAIVYPPVEASVIHRRYMAGMPRFAGRWFAGRNAVPAVLIVLMSLLACGGDRRLQRVVIRLGSADFVGVPGSLHEPVVEIGSEARPVLVAPEAVPVAISHELRPADGMVTFSAHMPLRARLLPNAAYVLTGSRRDFLPDDDGIAIGAAFVSEEVVSNWTLLRPSPDEVVVRARVPPGLGERFVLTLRAFGAAPSRLASRRFDVPAGSELVLGYGVAGDGSPVRARFRAWLTCRGVRKRMLVRDRADPGDSQAVRWREARVQFPDAMTGCTIVLRQEAGTAAERAVWCPPYFLGPDSPRSPGSEPRNVVIISLDTLRADHLSGYGYKRLTSPAIDARLIARGTTFTQVSTTFPLTQVAHMSLFTGLYGDAQPNGHTVPSNSSVTLLAERFRDAGFETAAYTEDAALAGSFGFWHGFAQFTEQPFVDAARGRQTFRDGARFVRDHRDSRFFLFLHTYKVHRPYTSSPPYAAYFVSPAESAAKVAPATPAADRENLDKYDRAIREVDDQVAGFLDALEEVGVADETLVVLLSDHGEAFGGHGFRGHGSSGYQSQIAIPLVFRGPGVRAHRIDTPVSIIDVAPTVLELMGLPALPLGQGLSLRAGLAGKPVPSRPLLFAWVGSSAGVRTGWMKYLPTADGDRMFDLQHDPGETNPLDADSDGLPRVARLVHEQNGAVRQRLEPRRGVRLPPVVPRRVTESLHALGYL